jgi:hypothetical protein
MKKHALAALFLFFSIFFLNAQLTLQQVGGNKKHVIPIETLIDMTFPAKTSSTSELAFDKQGGYFKSINKTSINVVLTYRNYYFTDENGVIIQETRRINPPDTPMITQVPLANLQSILQYYPPNKNISNIGFTFFLLAIVNNIFVAPHLRAPYNTTVRNAGYAVMGVGLSFALIPNRKTYYLEQPKGKNKTLWRLVN